MEEGNYYLNLAQMEDGREKMEAKAKQILSFRSVAHHRPKVPPRRDYEKSASHRFFIKYGRLSLRSLRARVKRARGKNSIEILEAAKLPIVNKRSFDGGASMPMLTDEQVIALIRNQKHDFHARYGVHKIGLFGSFARKEQTEASDIDIAIEMEPEKKNIHNFLAFKRHLERELGRKVDLGIEGALKPEARKFIEKEIIYV